MLIIGKGTLPICCSLDLLAALPPNFLSRPRQSNLLDRDIIVFLNENLMSCRPLVSVVLYMPTSKVMMNAKRVKKPSSFCYKKCDYFFLAKYTTNKSPSILLVCIFFLIYFTFFKFYFYILPHWEDFSFYFRGQFATTITTMCALLLQLLLLLFS